MLAKMDAHRDTQDDESRSKFDSGWLVVAVVWRVATKQRKANRFLDVADGVGWFYASNRTLVLMLVYAHLKFVSRDQC